MSGLEDEALYKKGHDKDLDRKFAQYKKNNIWAGDGYQEALTDNEVRILGKLWRKERMNPKKIQTQEVIKLVARFSYVYYFMNQIHDLYRFFKP